MATPGWYPDPAGRPGAYRFWDGSAWGDDLRSDPSGPPPAGATPHPPGPPASTNPFDQPTVPPGSAGAPETRVSGSPLPPDRPGSEQPWGSAPPPPSGPPYQQPPPPYPQQPYPQQPYPQQPPPGGYSAGYSGDSGGYGGGYRGPGGGGQGPPARSGGGGRGRAVGLIVLAVVAVVALGVGSFLVVGAFVDGGDGGSAGGTTGASSSATDPTSGPTTDPTSDPTSDPTTDPTSDPTEPVEPTTRQCQRGRPDQEPIGESGGVMAGGGLRMPVPRGFDNGDAAAAFTFAHGVYAPSREIQAQTDSQPGWVAVYALGGLPRPNGYSDLQQATATVLACMTGSDTFYTDITSVETVVEGPITVDGASAYQVTVEIRVDVPGLGIPGDRVQLVAVDTGDPTYLGLYASIVTIGEARLVQQQQAQLGQVSIG